MTQTTSGSASARETTTPRFPGEQVVINGNGAVAHVMSHVCGGVIGFPITPSTEISELYEAARAEGRRNVWGKHPFFFEPEGEHSAQSGALGAALTGGQYVSNASSSQGILYAMESHFVTVGKKIGGFVLQIAARVVSKHSLNVMAGHDDVYALMPSGYTILFGSNPQEAADLAAIAYRTSALSLIPVANAMDGFSTSHMLSEARLPEPELLRDYLGDPAGRIPAPPWRRTCCSAPRVGSSNSASTSPGRPASSSRTTSTSFAHSSAPRRTRSKRTTPASWWRRRWPGCPRNCTAAGGGNG